MNKLALIEKIYFLETKLGERWIHPLLEPFNFDSSDIIQVQAAAKKIQEHCGWDNHVIDAYFFECAKVS